MHAIHPDTTTYASQWHSKVVNFQAQIKKLGSWAQTVPIKIHDSEPTHYRMRAEFRIWHEHDDIFYAMFAPEHKRTPIKVEQFLPVSHSIYKLMPALLDSIKLLPECRHKLFQINFLSTQTNQILVTLLYHRPLDDAWERAARQLMQQFGVQIIGRSRKQKHVLQDDYLIETLTINDQVFRYQQYEGAFSQPNAGVNEKMIAWVGAQTLHKKHTEAPDLLELYCGNGNFTLPLAQYYRQILATEIAKQSVRAALYNIDNNNINNVQLVRLSSAEVSQALSGFREFRRLQHINLSSYRFGTVFVDPPRAGLDKPTLALLSKFDRIIYISCNPVTFIDNLNDLKHTHKINALAVFDQFPYTPHLEIGVVLEAYSL